MSADWLALATSGTINRNDLCPECHHLMFYRTNGASTDARVLARFCGNFACSQVFVEIPETDDGR